MNRYRKRKSSAKNNIVKAQADEIAALKKKIFDLEIDNKKKDELLSSIDVFTNNLQEITDDLRQAKEKYYSLISELMEMRRIINKTVFKGRWKLIRFLLK